MASGIRLFSGIESDPCLTAPGPHRVCLVGAGNVSHTHAEVLETIGAAELVAVVDPQPGRAHALATAHGLQHVFTELDDAIASGTFDFAHVLVPPDLHTAVAAKLVAMGIGVLLEKPMGVSGTDCDALVGLAKEKRVSLGVNHNAVFYPAYVELRDAIAANSFGPLQHVIVTLNFPARTLGPPGHWMLRHPRNLAFESGIHPFSQIYDLAGPVMRAHTTLSGRHELGAHRCFYDTWQVSLVCRRATAQLFLSYGGSYRTWQVVAICQDGMATAEVEQNRVTFVDRTRWGRYHEPLHLATTVAAQELERGVRNLAREIGAVLRPVPRRDTYFASMKASIDSFHLGRCPDQRSLAGTPALENGREFTVNGAERNTQGVRPQADGTFGAHVVAMCDAATADIPTDIPAGVPAPRSAAAARHPGTSDVVVLGGTGFIGRELVGRLVEAGMTVRVVARHTGLPVPPLDDPAVQLMSGDVADPAGVARAIHRARAVIHLAHGGSFTWDGVERTMVKPATAVAETCVRHDTERLLYAGTIASLYLGDRRATITGATPTDPRARERGPYEWGKAESERVLRGYAERESLPLCILRPGIVLGAGGTLFHEGFGMWRTDTHCVGWNRGTNPLPLVLARDVAAAMMLALERPEAVGSTYNLVGSVRLSAREYVDELKPAIQRPIAFHPMYPVQHQAVQVSKWAAKLVLRRRRHPWPSFRSVKSMGCVSAFDCSDAERDLGWRPLTDRNAFIEQAIAIPTRQGR